VAEPLIQKQGRNRIVVELPGVLDTAEAKRILGKTANLEFRLEASPIRPASSSASSSSSAAERSGRAQCLGRARSDHRR
jgi:preprotein translocase subunit SecD